MEIAQTTVATLWPKEVECLSKDDICVLTKTCMFVQGTGTVRHLFEAPQYTNLTGVALFEPETAQTAGLS